MRPRLFPASIVLALSALACDSKPPSGPIPVHPVSGQVVYRGRPVRSAVVVLHRDGGEPRATTPEPGGEPPAQAPIPTGKTDAEGRFQIHTYIGPDGAPTGTYKVTIVLAGTSENRDFMTKGATAPPDVTLPAKYANTAQSGLTATVKAGDNVIPPFEL